MVQISVPDKKNNHFWCTSGTKNGNCWAQRFVSDNIIAKIGQRSTQTKILK